MGDTDGALASLLAEVLEHHLLPLLTYTERRALGGTCSRLRRLTDASFNGLRLSFPDPSRASDRQIFDSFIPDSPRFLAALDYAINKGSVIKSITACGSLFWHWVDRVTYGPVVHHLAGPKGAELTQLWVTMDSLGGRDLLATLGLSCRKLADLWLDGLVLRKSSVASFAGLSRFDTLSSLRIDLKDYDIFPAQALAGLPLRQLREFRFSLTQGADEEYIQSWVDSWPYLPALELVGFGITLCPQITLPWAQLPSLCALEGFFVIDAMDPPPQLALIRHLVVGSVDNECELGARLLCLLKATGSLEKLTIPLREKPSMELMAALARQAGTLRFLRIDYESSDFDVQLLHILRRLPGLRELHIIEAPNGCIDYELVCRAAAALPALRRIVEFSTHVCWQDPELMQKCGQIIVDEVLPARPPGPALRFKLSTAAAAIAMRDAISAYGPEATDGITFDWVNPATSDSS